ncbi:MAG: hypothetical protein HY321_05530 [Armatimonadetes bacterium]|nr:hypothetical protein [Armatimonadota bacterium]
MRRWMVSVAPISALAIGLAGVVLPAAPGKEATTVPRFINDRRELFVDDWLIDRMESVTLKLHSPLPREVALPAYGGGYSYATVFRDEDRYRMYWRGSTEGAREMTAYAESADGISWVKPDLGLFEVNGSKANNIVWLGHGAHNFTPFKDANPDSPPEERYKAVAGMPMIGLVSPDGIRWRKLQEEPLIPYGPRHGAFDSQNVVFWDTERGEYVLFKREYRNGVRTIRRCTSQDFRRWSAPEWCDFGDTPPEHLYTNAATPYFRAPHIYLAFPRRFVPDRKRLADWPHDGVSDSVFMSSRDGIHWDRRFMEAFVRQGSDRQNWTDRNGTIAWGVVPTAEDEVSIYWTEHNRLPTCRLRRAALRTDGFVSVHAGYAGGEFVTKPLVFGRQEYEEVTGERALRLTGRPEGIVRRDRLGPLSQLSANYATSAVGYIRVEIQDADGQPIEGYELTGEIYGDEIDGAIAWPGGADVSKLAGRPIRLRFVLKDADVYALRFRE